MDEKSPSFTNIEDKKLRKELEDLSVLMMSDARPIIEKRERLKLEREKRKLEAQRSKDGKR